jgi:hypothetical protein
MSRLYAYRVNVKPPFGYSAAKSLLKMSAAAFHSPPALFQTTTYLPESFTGSVLP